MSTTFGEAIKKSSKGLTLTTGCLVSQLPGLTYFFRVTPPGFRALILLSTGGTVAIYLWAFLATGTTDGLVRRGSRMILIAIIVASIYGFVFPRWTVESPAERPERIRYQIGFGMASFSLTDKAQEIAREQEIDTPDELMLAFGAYQDGAINRVWKDWTIVTASVLLITLFTGSYVSWVLGLAFCARALSEKPSR